LSRGGKFGGSAADSIMEDGMESARMEAMCNEVAKEHMNSCFLVSSGSCKLEPLLYHANDKTMQYA
jgi:hypothetical protein